MLRAAIRLLGTAIALLALVGLADIGAGLAIAAFADVEPPARTVAAVRGARKRSRSRFCARDERRSVTAETTAQDAPSAAREKGA